jgi:Holliday junction resolvase RusA-like endonuclease
VRLVLITIPGVPRGKGRPRFVRATGRTYTPEQTASYEGVIRHEASLEMRGEPPMEGPLAIAVTAVVAMPKRFGKKHRQAVEAGQLWPTTRPDADNYLKTACDALNGIVYRDDSQLVRMEAVKCYGAAPRLSITVRGMTT